MKIPKVSVIVPVYNTEKYLVKCLDSLVNQTLNEMEIIVIDDGSNDSSPQIIKDYCTRYPEKFVYLRQKNSGQAVARNRGMEICTGEYIGFLDSDDFVKETMFECMYEKAIQNDADYVACGYTDITYEGDKTIELQHYVASKVAKQTKDMFFGALVSPFIHLYRHEILITAKASFPEGKIYEDTAFYLELIPYIKKIEVIEEPLAYRVRHCNSTTTTFVPKKIAQIFSIIDETIEFYQKNQLWNDYKEELTYFCVKILLCSSMQRICKIEEKKARKALIGKTLIYLRKKFPVYRQNPYLKRGLQNFYIRSFNRITAGFYTSIIRIKGKQEGQYI